MGIRAVGAMRRAKLMIGGRILALAVQFTLARDAAAQLATDQPSLQMEQQCESALALCASHMVVAETAGYVHQIVGLCESPGDQNGFTASLSTRCQTARVIILHWEPVAPAVASFGHGDNYAGFLIDQFSRE